EGRPAERLPVVAGRCGTRAPLGGTGLMVGSWHAGSAPGSGAVGAVEQFVEDELLGPVGGAQQAIDVHVRKAPRDVGQRRRQTPGLTELAQLRRHGSELERSPAQRLQSRGKGRRRSLSEIQQRLQAGPLRPVPLAYLAPEVTVDPELPAEALSRPSRHGPLLLER